MTIWIKHGGKRLNLFSVKPRGKVLDFPAGNGHESTDLREIGFWPVPADLFPKMTHAHQLPWTRADATQPFPFHAASFDYVLSREGIEHLETQALFLRECARVLKPGGEIVLTTPNVMHLRSRLTYFLPGQRTLRRGLINEAQTLRSVKEGRYYHGHAFLIDYFRLRYLLRLSGFDNIQVFTDRFSPASVALFWLVPVLFFASKLGIRMSMRKWRRKRLKFPEDSVFSEILGHVFSLALLFGKRMIVVAQKIPSK